MVTGDNGEIYGSSMEYLDGFHYSTSNGDELWAIFQSSGGGAYESEAFMAFLNENNYADVLKFVPTAEGFYDLKINTISSIRFRVLLSTSKEVLLIR